MLVVHQKQPWLAGSPDGISLSQDGTVRILEIKCPESCEDKEITMDYLITSQNGELLLKRSSPYFAQIQINMLVTNLKLAHFFVWSSVDYKLL